MRPSPVTTVSIPPEPAAPARAPVPLLASAVPVLGALALWLATGSAGVLWFALLGPLMAAASLIDGRRAARRARRLARAQAAHRAARTRAALSQAHRDERDRLRQRHPDAAGFGADPAQIWRNVPGRAGMLVLGSGEVESTVRVAGEPPRGAAAEVIAEAPVVVPAAVGVAVIGPEPWASGVVRGLALQLLCQHPPGALMLAGPAPQWAAEAPHREPAPLRLALDRPGEPDALGIVALAPGGSPPPGCGAVLTLTGAGRGRLDHDGTIQDVRVEAVAPAQAAALVALLRDRSLGVRGPALPERIGLDALPGATARSGLAVAIGMTADGPLIVDLVADGPHAVVAGMTGAGKSELLVTWVAALAAAHGVEEVTFLLVDFKGGTAFRRLARIPHVTGVITDLDAALARRAVASLGAEIRHREAELAAVGGRDFADAGLPRLVVVVDEFAALLDQAPELAAVFTDVAARGRALGIHLVLGTQRAAGVVREALLANCPLRISLPVADAADSRFLLGVDDAADAVGSGIAFVRTPVSRRPLRARVAMTSDADIAALAADPPAARPRSPWLPELPAHLPVGSVAASGIVLGLADEPERQRQSPVRWEPADGGLAVLGGPASGRSGLLAAVLAQDARAIRLPSEPEAAWDLLARLAADPPAAGVPLVCDDVDVLLTRFPPDYAAALAERVVVLTRSCGLRPVLAAARFAGPAARLAEACGRRVLLRLPTRLDHIAAGGDPADHDPRAPRGRGSLDGRRVQFVCAPVPDAAAPDPPAPWSPGGRAAAVVVAAAATVRRTLAAFASAGVEAGEPGAATDVVVGDVDQWQRAWSQLSRLRADGDLVVDAACAAEYRMLTGDRGLPPYCEPGSGRAWHLAGGEAPRRVLLPGAPHLGRVVR